MSGEKITHSPQEKDLHKEDANNSMDAKLLKEILQENLIVGKEYTINDILKTLQSVQDKYDNLAEFLKTNEAKGLIHEVVFKSGFDFGETFLHLIWTNQFRN